MKEWYEVRSSQSPRPRVIAIGNGSQRPPNRKGKSPRSGGLSRVPENVPFSAHGRPKFEARPSRGILSEKLIKRIKTLETRGIGGFCLLIFWAAGPNRRMLTTGAWTSPVTDRD
jgi:hypothetical protein